MGDVAPVYIYAEEVPGGSKVRILPTEYLLTAAPKTATIVVNYTGSWDLEAKAAFEYAKGIWETLISSPVPIVVDASWEDLNYISPDVLGGAGATDYGANFTGSPVANTWYPYSLANRLYGFDLNDKIADIDAIFNSSFPAWYFGTDGNPPNDRYDFASVVLHEIGHGLGFSGSMRVSGGTGSWGSGTSYPVIFDRFAINGSGQVLLSSFTNFSSALAVQLQSNNLYFSGSHAVAANGGNPPKLYAPASWQQGSSFSHLDESTYPSTGENNLMTPQLTNGEAVHLPGAITLGIFQDIGWGGSPVATTTVTPSRTPTKTSTPSKTYTSTPKPTVTATKTPTPTHAYREYLPSIHRLAPTVMP